MIEVVWADPPPPDPVYVAPDSHRAHGTYVKYVVERCKCEPCMAANRDYERRRLQMKSRPDEVWMPYVPAARARAHLEELQAAGVGYKTVAELAGLAQSAVGKILWSTRYRGMGRSKRIRAETERKILAVRLEDAAGGQKVPGEATWKLLDDLIARGFTKAWISQALGKKQPSLQIRRDVVRASTARAVRDLHARLDGVEAPPRRSRWDTR